MSVLFYGGICKDLIRSGYVRNTGKVFKLYYPSPISLGGINKKMSVSTAVGRGIKLDLEKDLDTFLEERNCDYLILDLANLLCELFCIEGTYYTFPAKNLQEQYPFNIDSDLVTEIPVDHAPEVYFDSFDTFIDSLLRHFSGNRIVLIHTMIPKYFVVGRYVKKYESGNRQKWLDCFEQRFREKTECLLLDITKYYFLKKESKNIKPYGYEELCYRDIAFNIEQILNNSGHFSTNNSLDMQSIYNSYIRYSEYYINLDKGFLNVFLTDNVIDEYVKACHEEWVLQNINVLVLLRKMNFKNADELLSFLENHKIDSEFFMCLESYCYVIRQMYDVKGVRYDLLFEKRHAVPDLLEEVQNFALREKLVVSKKQINFYNYSYYFYLMLSSLTSAKNKKKELLKISESFGKNVVKDPYLVDVWGSCISRLPINYNEKNIAVENYLFQVPPIGLFDAPVTYDDRIFNIGKRKIWRDKLAKIQLERRAKLEIKNSKALWVILDLFTLSAGNICKYSGEIFCLEPKVIKALSAERIDLYNDEKMMQYVKSELYIFASFLRQKYKNNIILIKNKRSEFFLNSNRKIEVFKGRNRNMEKNAFTNECNELLFKYLDCYYIDIVDQFLGDELNLFELTPTHFEEELYWEEGRIIQDIIENKPEKKHVNTYSNRVRVNRIIKLRKNNENNQIVRNLFTSDIMDAICLNTSIESLEQYKELWIELYDQHFTEKEEMMCYIDENPRFSVIAPYLSDSKEGIYV